MLSSCIPNCGNRRGHKRLRSSGEEWQVHVVGAPELVGRVIHLDIANFTSRVGQLFSS